MPEPAGWRRARIGGVSTVHVGGTPSTYVPAYWGRQILWMNSGDLHQKRISNIEPRITQRGLQSSSAVLIDPPTVAIGLVGQGKTGGTVAFVLQRLACSQSVALTKPRDDWIDARYLFRNLDWRYNELRSLSAGGSGRGVLSKPLLEKLPISLPSLPEQRRIADIFDTLDEQLFSVQSLLAKKSQVVTALAAQIWQRSSSEWTLGKLDEVTSISAGLTLGSEPNGPNSVELPYLRVANVQDGFIDTTEMKTVRVLRNETDRFAVQPGDILLTEGGDFDKLGRGAVWDGRINPCLHQNHIFRVRCRRDKLIPEFLAGYISSPVGRRYFLNIAKQTTNLASINSTQLKAMLHMEHALRRHISERRPGDRVRYEKLSERLERILDRLGDDAEQRARALEELIRQEREAESRNEDGLDPLTERPIYSLIEQRLGTLISERLGEAEAGVFLLTVTHNIMEIVYNEASPPHFLESAPLQEKLRKRVLNYLMRNIPCDRDVATPLAEQTVGVVGARWSPFRW